MTTQSPWQPFLRNVHVRRAYMIGFVVPVFVLFFIPGFVIAAIFQAAPEVFGVISEAASEAFQAMSEAASGIREGIADPKTYD